MSFMRTIAMALKAIRKNKIRSVLTMLGIIIGVASVITLVATIQGIQQMQNLMMEAMGVNRIDMSIWTNSSRTRESVVEYCEDAVGQDLLAIAPTAQNQMEVKYRTKTMQNTNVYFSNEQYGLCTSQSMAAGRDLTLVDIKNRARVCVIGEAVKKNFFGAMSPMGQSIKLGGQSYQVIGVYKGKFGGKLNTEDQMILVPYTLQKRLTGMEDTSNYVMRGKNTEQTKAFIEQLTAFAQTKIPPDSANEYFYAYSNDQYQEQNQQQYNMMSLVAGSVAGISLLVGGIGIMNIMLVSVTERTREIGIRMAIGARRRDIIGQFLIEAGAVSACGGLIGIAIGVFGTAMLGGIAVRYLLSSPYMPDIPSMVVLPSMPLVLGAFLFSAMLGVIFGLYPANKASKMQPVEALRTQ